MSVLTGDRQAAVLRPRRRLPDSPRWSPASALAETTATYDADSVDLAARQWEADFGAYLDAFVRLIPEGSHPIVDAGCGAGRDMAAFVARGFSCVGVDLSAGMLARARARLTDPCATWLQADIRAIPFGTASAGGVWTNAALLHLDSDGQLAALREFRRLLLPGGPLFVTTLAGSGWSSRHTGTGLRRWFWGTDVVGLSKLMSSLGFHIVSAKGEAGLVQGEWVNVLALAPRSGRGL